jgi:hypothetical protein
MRPHARRQDRARTAACEDVFNRIVLAFGTYRIGSMFLVARFPPVPGQRPELGRGAPGQCVHGVGCLRARVCDPDSGIRAS